MISTLPRRKDPPMVGDYVWLCDGPTCTRGKIIYVDLFNGWFGTISYPGTEAVLGTFEIEEKT